MKALIAIALFLVVMTCVAQSHRRGAAQLAAVCGPKVEYGAPGYDAYAACVLGAMQHSADEVVRAWDGTR